MEVAKFSILVDLRVWGLLGNYLLGGVVFTWKFTGKMEVKSCSASGFCSFGGFAVGLVRTSCAAHVRVAELRAECVSFRTGSLFLSRCLRVGSGGLARLLFLSFFVFHSKHHSKYHFIFFIFQLFITVSQSLGEATTVPESEFGSPVSSRDCWAEARKRKEDISYLQWGAYWELLARGGSRGGLSICENNFWKEIILMGYPPQNNFDENTLTAKKYFKIILVFDLVLIRWHIPLLDEGMSYTQVSAGCVHTVLLRSDGSVVTFGGKRCRTMRKSHLAQCWTCKSGLLFFRLVFVF